MPGSNVLFEKFLMSDEIDEEDAQYLQKSFWSLLSSSKDCGNSNGEVMRYGHRNSELNGQSVHQKTDCPAEDNVVTNCCEANSHDQWSENKNIFSKTHQYDPESLYNCILSSGIDSEDLYYIKRSFFQSLEAQNQGNWIRKIHWDSHPTTCDEDGETGKYFEINRHHLNRTGSARSEGFYRIDKLSVKRVKTRRSTGSTSVNRNVITLYSKKYRGNKGSLSRDARNNQRRLSTAYQTITGSDLLKLNDLKFRTKKLRLGKSEIHGLGIFASEPIAPNEIIIEYVGQIIRPIIADLREKIYKSSGLGSYCFRIDDDTIIDATKYGNLNRYINHSCSPNSYAKILIFNNHKKIVMYSKRSIKVDEEITYDYKMPLEDDKIVCLCRAPGCRKSLN